MNIFSTLKKNVFFSKISPISEWCWFNFHTWYLLICEWPWYQNSTLLLMEILKRSYDYSNATLTFNIGWMKIVANLSFDMLAVIDLCYTLPLKSWCSINSFANLILKKKENLSMPILNSSNFGCLQCESVCMLCFIIFLFYFVY